MNRIVLILISLFIGSFLLNSCSQNADKKTVRKDIRIEKSANDIKIEITEEENGKTTQKTLTGEEARKYLAGHDAGSIGEITVTTETDHTSEGSQKVSKMVMLTDEMMDNGSAETEELLEKLETLGKNIDALDKKEIAELIDAMIADYRAAREKAVAEWTGLKNATDFKVKKEDGKIIIEGNQNGKKFIRVLEDGENWAAGETIFVVNTSGNAHMAMVEDNVDNGMLHVNVNRDEDKLEITLQLDPAKEASVTITAPGGEKIFDKTFTGKAHRKLEIETKKDEKGTYKVKVEQGGEVLQVNTAP